MFVLGVTCALAYGEGPLALRGLDRGDSRRGHCVEAGTFMSHHCCSCSPSPSWFTSPAAAVSLTKAIARVLLDHPGATLAHAAILPDPVRSIPTCCRSPYCFVSCSRHADRRAADDRTSTLAGAPSSSALVGARSAGPSRHGRTATAAFDPLAWQLLVVLGAWSMLEDKRVRPWVTSRTALGLAVLYLLFSLVIALSWRIEPLEALIPQALAKLLYPLDKSNLHPLRLLHFLAIAVLAAWFVPRNWRGLTTPVMRGAIRCGQNSLPIYCLGVLLAFAGHMALLQHLGRACDADSGESRRHRGDDRDRSAAELDRPSASYSQRQKSGVKIFHIKSQANDLFFWDILFLVVIFALQLTLRPKKRRQSWPLHDQAATMS